MILFGFNPSPSLNAIEDQPQSGSQKPGPENLARLGDDLPMVVNLDHVESVGLCGNTHSDDRHTP